MSCKVSNIDLLFTPKTVVEALKLQQRGSRLRTEPFAFDLCDRLRPYIYTSVLGPERARQQTRQAPHRSLVVAASFANTVGACRSSVAGGAAVVKALLGTGNHRQLVVQMLQAWSRVYAPWVDADGKSAYNRNIAIQDLIAQVVNCTLCQVASNR